MNNKKPLMTDQQLLGFWVAIWAPIVSGSFLVAMLSVSWQGRLLTAGFCCLVYVYVLFAPGLYFAFFRK